MRASCPSCRTPILGPRLPDACPACGADLAGVVADMTGTPVPVAPPATLVLYSPDGLSAEFPVKERAGLGRHYDNQVVVADREVSKHHAAVRFEQGAWMLRDLGSSNGTFVNGRRVDELKLRDGDEIRVGASRLVFRTQDAPEQRRSLTVVQAPSVTQVLASVKPTPTEESAVFLPAGEITDAELLKKDYERLRIAFRFHQEVGPVVDRESLLQLILRLALQWLPADNGVILVPGDDGAFDVALAESLTGEAEINVSRTLVEQVARTGEGVLSNDAVTDDRFSGSESIVARGVRSVLAVPVIVREDVRAIVYLDSQSRTSAFTPKDLDILGAVASQAAASLHNAELLEQIRHEEKTRGQLERFLSPALVQQAAAGELDLKKGGSSVRATILFADIRGFTSLSETLPAEEVVSMLNEYFEEMVEVVFDYRGVLDKFIGDAVMALWGVPVAGEGDAARATQAALEMQRRTAEFNARRVAAGRSPIAVGIGVNTGECVVGNMGSSRRLEYTVIGDAVNLASRLCDVAAGGEVIVSEDTAAALGDGFVLEALPEKQVKGKARPVPIHRVHGETD